MTTTADTPRDPRPALLKVLLACLPALALMAWLYGWGLAWQLLLSVVTCCGCDLLTRRLRQQPRPLAAQSLFGCPPLAEGSALVTGLLLALAMPPGAPWWLTVSAAGFASLFGKSLFGGYGYSPFNPAMLGVAFALVAWPAQMSQWPLAANAQSLVDSLQQVFGLGGGLADGWSQATLLDSLRHNQSLTMDELFARNPAFGSLGAHGVEWVNAAFLLGGLFLLQQRVIGWQAPVGMLGALLVISLLAWGGSGSDSNGSPLLHLFSGATMLGAFFIVTEPISGPAGLRARLYFGIGVGLLTYAIRTWGGYPDGLAFAVLLMNLCVPLLDRLDQRRAAGMPPA